MKLAVRVVFIIAIFVLGANAFSEAFKEVFNKDLYRHKRAVAENPENPATYIKLGDSYLASGMYKEAIEPLIVATKLQPKRAETYYSLGKAY